MSALPAAPICANAACGAQTSPPGAHFCIACGYPLLQPCPYEGCEGEVAVCAGMPRLLCSACRRFLLYCPHCRRLHRLNEKICRTRRCREAGRQVREWFAPCHGALGDDAQNSVASLPETWIYDQRAALPGDWGQLCEVEGWGGVAFRYGQLVALGRDALWLRSLSRHTKTLLNSAPRRVLLDRAALAPASLFASSHALRLAHGYAYILAEGAAFRVRLSPSATGEAPEAEHLAFAETPAAPQGDWDDWEQDTPPESPPDLSRVQWRLHATTPTRWLALGEIEGQAIGVQSGGFDAHFTAAAWPPPPEPARWRELLTQGESVFLTAENGLWHENNGGWQQLWATPPGETLRGALPFESGFLVWGDDASGLWVRHRNENAMGQPMRVPGVSWPVGEEAQIAVRPVLLGTTLYFWVRTQRAHVIAALDVESHLGSREPLPLALNQSCLWALGARAENEDFLIYALRDDEGDVSFVARRVRPLDAGSWTIKKLRPRRQMPWGAALVATICDGRLTIAVCEENGAKGLVFDLSATD